jgi:acetyl esterase/lipase
MSDLSFEPNPVAILGFNPVCDVSKDGFGHKCFPPGMDLAASPLHLVNSEAPPIFMVHGDADVVVPVSQARAMAGALEKSGVRHRLIEYEGQGHGFFNASPYLESTLKAADSFLVDLGILPAGL